VQRSAEPAATRLTLPTPYDRSWTTWYLAGHAVSGAERYRDGRYAAAVRTPDGADVVTLDFASRAGEVWVSSARSGRPSGELVARVRALLDVDADGAAVDRHLARDPALASAVAAAPGVRVPGALDGWELLLRTMVGQQISLPAARTHLSRLVASVGEPVEGVAGWRLLPTAEVVADRGRDVLTGPRARVESVVAAAAAVAGGALRLSPQRDGARLRGDLLGLRGVGPWTAAYVVMRLCGDPDLLLTTDLVVRQGATVLGADLSRSARWSPYRSYATMHLWRAALGARPGHTWASGNDSVSEGSPADHGGLDAAGQPEGPDIRTAPGPGPHLHGPEHQG
jgi:AraC family transcriptional regulator of adaptative response / DNA-3-methyladenine glycosylase II